MNPQWIYNIMCQQCKTQYLIYGIYCACIHPTPTSHAHPLLAVLLQGAVCIIPDERLACHYVMNAQCPRSTCYKSYLMRDKQIVWREVFAKQKMIYWYMIIDTFDAMHCRRSEIFACHIQNISVLVHKEYSNNWFDSLILVIFWENIQWTSMIYIYIYIYIYIQNTFVKLHALRHG